MKRIAIVLLGIILAAGVGGIGGYMYGVDEGYSDGYNAGYQAGYSKAETGIMCSWLEWCLIADGRAYSSEGQYMVVKDWVDDPTTEIDNIIHNMVQDVVEEFTPEMWCRCEEHWASFVLDDVAYIGGK